MRTNRLILVVLVWLVPMVAHAQTRVVEANSADALTALQNIDTSLNNIEAGLGQDCAEAAASSLCPSGPITVLKFDDTSPTTVSEDQTVRMRGSATGEAYSVIRDAAGNNRGANVNASNQLTVIDANSASALTALQLIDNLTTDPCGTTAKSFIPIDVTTATTTELTSALAGASTHYYICALNLVTDAANDVSLVDDDTDNCASVTSAIVGGLTAAEGWNFAANGGVVIGNGGASVMRTVGTNRVLCLVTGAATQLAGHIVVVAAP